MSEKFHLTGYNVMVVVVIRKMGQLVREVLETSIRVLCLTFA